ncbi:MAG: acyl-[acyl-carrier-protein]--UDP-N-acetylglucosamine O-acyltransferase [Ignavibacteria bacterium GWF2_33_9]|nr:MAG: acyl-[acyl-carrier-protein]--UDP-N-acetylglucosamine O-acyltransferase [Ignavibacteria bacterium GWF2_33_9]
MDGVSIHSTAIVSPKAQLGTNVEVGPFTIIKDNVVIGDNTSIGANNYIDNGVTIGNNCKIFHHIVLGTAPQDLKYNNEETFLKIGDNNTIREFVGMNRATTSTYITNVGSNNLIMQFSHIAHDCKVGNNVIMSNSSTLAGHVHIEDWVIMGGFAKVHQFCVIGKHAFLGADTFATKDVVPYAIVSGSKPKFEGINFIGLRRRGFSDETISEISNFYKFLFNSGMNNSDALAKFTSENNPSETVSEIINFISSSTRGIYRN